MEREINQYRAKDLSGNWVFGSLVVSLWNTYIIPMYDCSIESPQFISVDPKTVGQYTGLKDKNGKEIYEGEILDLADGYAKVIYANYSASYEAIFDDDGNIGLFEQSPLIVVGNIFDTPELIGGK